MKRWIVALAALLTPSLAFAAIPITERPSVTVTGEAEVRIVPDEVFFTVAVTTVDRDVITASNENEAKVKRLVESAQKFGIPAHQVQTSEVSISRRENDKRVLLGFQVQRSVTLCLKDLAKFEELLAELVKNGANDLPGIEFRSTKMEEAQAKARIDALKKAKAKAMSMAGELGEKIGRPISISETPNSFTRFAYTNASNRSTTHGGFAPGEIGVRVAVNVQFALDS